MDGKEIPTYYCLTILCSCFIMLTPKLQNFNMQESFFSAIYFYVIYFSYIAVSPFVRMRETQEMQNIEFHVNNLTVQILQFM